MELIDVKKLKTFLASKVTMMTDYDNGICESCIDEYIDEFIVGQQTDVQCEDAVSRQAAIDAIISFFKLTDYNESAYAVRTVLGDLPSVQSEPCEDAVSKEKILKFFDDWMSALDENCHNQSVSDLKIIKRDFENLPPVTPKQRTGKWIKITNTLYKCDQCGAVQLKGNYCKDCGAKMEGVNNETD